MPSDADESRPAVDPATKNGAGVNGADKPVGERQQPATDSSQPSAAADPTAASTIPPASANTTAPATTLNASPTSSITTSTSASSSSPRPFPSDAALLSHLMAHLSTADFEVVTNKTIIAHLQTHFQHDLSSKKAMIKEAINDFLANPQQHTATTHNGTHKQKKEQHQDGDGGGETEAAAADEAEEEEPEEQSEETQEDIDHRLAMELAAEDTRPRRSAAANSLKRAEKRKLKESTSSTTSTTTKKPKTKSNKPPTLYSLSPALSAFLPGTPTHMSWGDVVKALWVYFREHKLQDEKNRKRIVLDERLQSVFGKDRRSVDAFKMNTLLTKHMKKQDDLA